MASAPPPPGPPRKPRWERREEFASNQKTYREGKKLVKGMKALTLEPGSSNRRTTE